MPRVDLRAVLAVRAAADITRGARPHGILFAFSGNVSRHL
jgi:hypothetical protein